MKNTVRALREERIRQKWSMSELAGWSGLDVSMISLVERGLRRPSLEVLLRIADALKMDLWLVLKEATERARAEKS
ncbi:MAG: helix-turn-helix domain-containing protein [Chthoniobacteraceae bacterium]